VGACGRVDGGRLLLDAVVLSGDGTNRISAIGEDVPAAAEALGTRVAQDLIAKGATELIASSRFGQRNADVP
jgi:porphobilinogen deaminase